MLLDLQLYGRIRKDYYYYIRKPCINRSLARSIIATLVYAKVAQHIDIVNLEMPTTLLYNRFRHAEAPTHSPNADCFCERMRRTLFQPPIWSTLLEEPVLATPGFPLE
jgi:hypothetical protein